MRWLGGRLWIALGSALLLLGVAAGALAVWQRSVRAELALARNALAAGRYGVAQNRLSRLAKRWTNDGEVLLLLGEAHLALARREQALASWAKVPPSSPYFGRAAVLIGTHLTNSGRYTPAENVLIQALAQPDEAVHFELERALARVYRYEGRSDDLRRVICASWGRSNDPAGMLKELWAIDHSAMPVESWKRALDSADDNDDRVWLGRANFAILTGNFAEAAGWLERAIERRPDDLAAWRSRLLLATSAGDVPGVWEAASHLPAALFDTRAEQQVRAWLTVRGEERGIEERELTALLAANPADGPALERLAAPAFRAGRRALTDHLHRKKAEVDGAFEAIRMIVCDESKVVDRARELAQLMAVLHRDFDTQGWSIVAEARRRGALSSSGAAGGAPCSPLPPDLAVQATVLSSRFSDLPRPDPTGGPLLADRLADLRGGAAVAGALAGSHPPVSDSNPNAAVPTFVDDARARGLRFVFDNGQTPQRQLPETLSGGVGLLDYDGDGWLDVYCVQGGRVDDTTNASTRGAAGDGDRLFHNRGDGTFHDVTEASCIAKIAWGRGYGLGVTVGDYDNDGRPDLLVSRLRALALYRNRGDGTFEDVTGRAGLAGVRDNPTSAAFADLDNDGDLDLYVCHYMMWDPANPRLCRTEQGEAIYCHPSQVEPAPDYVLPQ